MLTDFENKVIEILEIVGEDPENNLPKCADKIHALADYLRNLILFKKGYERGLEFFKDSTPVEIYDHMIVKIAESSNIIIRDSAVILTIPFLSDKLKEIDN